MGGHAGALIAAAARGKHWPNRALNKAARIFTAAHEDRVEDPRFNGELFLVEAMSRGGLDTVFDVGANRGDWTDAVLRHSPTANVHAFELSPRTAQRLSTRFAGVNRVVVNSFGLSDVAGEVEFRDIPGASELNSLIVDNDLHVGRASTIAKARVERGDTYCERNGITRIDFLKVDAEGADHLVLRGFEEMFRSRRIRLVQFEYGYASVYSRFLIQDHADFFARFGYTIRPLRSRGVVDAPFSVTWNNFESGPNFVAMPDDDAKLLALVAWR